MTTSFASQKTKYKPGCLPGTPILKCNCTYPATNLALLPYFPMMYVFRIILDDMDIDYETGSRDRPRIRWGSPHTILYGGSTLGTH